MSRTRHRSRAGRPGADRTARPHRPAGQSRPRVAPAHASVAATAARPSAVSRCRSPVRGQRWNPTPSASSGTRRGPEPVNLFGAVEPCHLWTSVSDSSGRLIQAVSGSRGGCGGWRPSSRRSCGSTRPGRRRGRSRSTSRAVQLGGDIPTPDLVCLGRAELGLDPRGVGGLGAAFAHPAVHRAQQPEERRLAGQFDALIEQRRADQRGSGATPPQVRSASPRGAAPPRAGRGRPLHVRSGPRACTRR